VPLSGTAPSSRPGVNSAAERARYDVFQATTISVNENALTSTLGRRGVATRA